MRTFRLSVTCVTHPNQKERGEGIKTINFTQEKGEYMATYTNWTSLKFGKYEGKSLPEIVLRDPDWFYWAVGNRIFRGALDEEAAEVAYKARNILPPKPQPENWRIEYYFALNDELAGFRIVEANYPDDNPLQTEISTHLDLSYPRSLRPYDKLGNESLLECFRHCYFGDCELTKERCERFFRDDRNFVATYQ